MSIEGTHGKKSKWKGRVADSIDWEIHGSNLKRLQFYPHQFVVRLIYERLPCLGASSTITLSTTCPCYRKQEETFEHRKKCEEHQEKWEDIIEPLSTIYQKHKVDPIIHILLNRLIVDPEMKIEEIVKDHPEMEFGHCDSIIRDQTKIGWKQLRYRRWSFKWSAFQYIYESWLTGENKEENEIYLIWIRKIIR